MLFMYYVWRMVYILYVCFSCMANFERFIKSPNQKILNKSNLIQNQCNCADGCKCNFKGGNFRS